jgi:hypothetical protein
MDSITVRGTGIPQPLGTLSFSPAIVDFGNVVVGTTPPPSQTVTLTNTGNAALTIPSAPAAPAGFVVTGFPTGQLAAGLSTQFTVQFAPSGPVTVDPNLTHLTIVSTGSSNSPTDIPLAGTGVAQNPQLTFNPTNIGFGDVVVGGIPDPPRPVTVTNTGNFSVNITGSTPLAGFNVTGLTSGSLAPGASRPFFVQFLPTPLGGLVSGSISLTSNPAVSPNSFTVSGTGVSPGQLNLNPSSINFGTVVVGSPPVTRSITVMNTGGAPVDVTSIAVTAGAAVYSIGNFVPGPSPPTQTVAPGGSITFDVTFAPVAGGNSGTITVNSTAGNPAVTLLGTGNLPAPALTASPPSLSFGNVTVFTPVTQDVTITNTGNTTVTGITAAVLAGSDPSYSVTAVAPTTFPATLAPGTTAAIRVQFLPGSVSPPSLTGTIRVTSTAPNLNIGLSGNGTATPVGALSLNPTSLNFGSVVVGNTTAPQTVTMTNTGSGPAVTINSLTSSPPGVFTAVIVGPLLPRTLTNPGDTATFTVQFTPAAPGAVSPPGSVLVTTTANSPSVTLNGTGVATTRTLSVSPTNLDFGSVNVGSNSAGQQVTITNTGNTTVTGITATPSASFNLTLLPPASLAPGISGTFTVRFSPTAAGAAPAGSSVVVTSSATNSPNTVSLSGTGVTPVCTLTVSPTNINFGNVLVGGSGVTQNITLLNSCASDITLTINPLTGTGAATYSVLNMGLPLTLPFTQTLTPGQSSGFTIRFLPTAAVTSDASVRIDSNATNSPTTLSLTGTGTVGVSLSWDASTSVVVGYNVYRSTLTGGPYVRLNASVIPGTNYADSTAKASTTYFYVATAVDADGVESILSNELKVILP